MKTTYEWLDYFEKKYPGDRMNIPCAMEQAHKHSLKEKYCSDCASTENLVLQPAGLWITVAHYFCKECDEYWKNKS